MLTKETFLQKIVESGEKGITKSALYRGKEKETFENIIKELLSEGKIVEKNRRLFAKEALKLATPKPMKEEIVTQSEIQSLKNEFAAFKKDVIARLNELKNQIDRAYEYIDDIFIYMKTTTAGESTKTLLQVDELRIIYDNLNTSYNFGDSVPIPLFKDEIMKKYKVSEEELNTMLLDLDNKEIIHLQTIDDPEDFADSNRGITFENRIFYFITWMKRP
ncbi:MAG: hypothetical protein KBI30_03920 [Candidatus Atribacteria bacterium]|nr:hypothetical protein [Candidatus Atribacteria bacterium]